MSFGTQQYGLDPFGGLPAALGISYAYAISTNEIVVVLNKPPASRSGFLAGDVSNPNSWKVEIPLTSEELDVIGVVAFAAPLQWVVRTHEKLPPSTITARVTAVGLKDAAGNVVGPSDHADFAGVTEAAYATPAATAATASRARDLANYAAPVIGGDSTNLSGTLVIRGGDYALMEGEALFKKLIIRRLMSSPSEFFHLTNYGVGLKVKQPLPAGELVKLKSTIERQIKLERGVSSVSVSVSQSLNVFTVQVRAQLASGQKVAVSLNSPIGQG